MNNNDDEKILVLYYLMERAQTADEDMIRVLAYFIMLSVAESDSEYYINSAIATVSGMGATARPVLHALLMNGRDEVKEAVRRRIYLNDDSKKYAEWLLPGLTMQLRQEEKYDSILLLLRAIGPDALPALVVFDSWDANDLKNSRKKEETEKLIKEIMERTRKGREKEDGDTEGGRGYPLKY